MSTIDTSYESAPPPGASYSSAAPYPPPSSAQPVASEPHLGRVPPQSIEAEACVLGSMMLDAAAIDMAVQLLQPEFFYRPAHELMYQALVDLRNAGKPIDLVLVKNELLQRKQLEQIGGVEYIVALAEGVPSTANVEYYARIVRDKAMLRQLIVAGTEMIREAYECRQEAPEVIDAAEQAVFRIAQNQIGQDTSDIRSLLQKTIEDLLNSEGKLITGLPTGYHKLDEITSGFQRGEMLILGARPSMGKTSCLLNIAEHMAVVERKPVAIFSLEMSKEQLAQRLLSSHSRFNLRQMRRGMIAPEDWSRLQQAAGELEASPIFIDDSPTLTILQLRAKARRLQATHGIEAIFIDYLQLMTYAGRADNRQEQVTEISRGIKALARELNVPVVTAAQLNRGTTERSGNRPRMSDLRESGSIEQDADVVMLLHNEDYYHRGESDYMPTKITELIVAKQRNGPTDTVKLTFLEEFTRFESLAMSDAFM